MQFSQPKYRFWVNVFKFMWFSEQSFSSLQKMEESFSGQTFMKDAKFVVVLGIMKEEPYWNYYIS